jgi:hypothetical protein
MHGQFFQAAKWQFSGVKSKRQQAIRICRNAYAREGNGVAAPALRRGECWRAVGSGKGTSRGLPSDRPNARPSGRTRWAMGALCRWQGSGVARGAGAAAGHRADGAGGTPHVWLCMYPSRQVTTMISLAFFSREYRTGAMVAVTGGCSCSSIPSPGWFMQFSVTIFCCRPCKEKRTGTM